MSECERERESERERGGGGRDGDTRAREKRQLPLLYHVSRELLPCTSINRRHDYIFFFLQLRKNKKAPCPELASSCPGHLMSCATIDRAVHCRGGSAAIDCTRDILETMAYAPREPQIWCVEAQERSAPLRSIALPCRLVRARCAAPDTMPVRRRG